MMQRTTVILAALLLCLCAGGCSHQGSSTTPAGPSSTPVAPIQGQGGKWSAYETLTNYASQRGTVVYQVTYQPNAVVFDQNATENALKGISADGTQYAIDASAPQAAALKPGSVLFLYGITIRKVTSVTRQGSNLVLATADADITDAIKDGHITWRVPIDPSVLGLSSNTGQPQSLEDIFASPALADTGLQPLGKWGFSFGGNQDKCKFDALLGWANPVLNLNLHAVCNPLYYYLTLDGTCTLHGPSVTGLLDIKGGVIDNIESSLEDLSLHGEFDWTAYTQHTSPITLMDRQVKIKLPGFPPIPLVIGGLPFALEISTAFLIHPAFTGREEVASGHFTINLGGDAGVSSTGADVQPQGKVTGSQSIDHGTGVVSARAMAFVAALELPRVELSFELLPSTYILDTIAANTLKIPGITPKGVSVKPYSFVNVVLSTAIFTNGAMASTLLFLPPCQRAQFMVTVNAGLGVKLNLLGYNKYLTALNKMTGPKAEFAVAKPILKHPFTLFKNGIKCPGD